MVPVLLFMKPDFPDDNRVRAGMVRDGLSIVPSDHTAHSLGKPRVNPQGLQMIPVQTGNRKPSKTSNPQNPSMPSLWNTVHMYTSYIHKYILHLNLNPWFGILFNEGCTWQDLPAYHFAWWVWWTGWSHRTLRHRWHCTRSSLALGVPRSSLHCMNPWR